MDMTVVKKRILNCQMFNAYIYVHTCLKVIFNTRIIIYMNYKSNKLKIDPNVWPVLVDKNYGLEKNLT